MRLSYCTNVHPAEDLDGVIAQLRSCAGPVRRRLGVDRLGVGLWLPAALAVRLDTEPGTLAALRAVLEEQGLVVTTLNAFPYTAFHAPVVKHAVYLPRWGEADRTAHTLSCARVLAALLPPGGEGSVSTLPLGWREPWTDEDDEAATAALVHVGRELRRLARSTGRTVRLAIEPEPGCVLDSVEDTVAWLSARTGDPDAGGIDAEHVGLCLDTCHLATSFADPAGAVRAVRAAGLRVFKLQASAALELPDPRDEAGRAALAAYAEPRYLHQVRARGGDGVVAVDDLSDVDAVGALPTSGPWRVHVHMPLHLAPRAPLRSTTEVLLAAATELGTELEGIDVDVETYTWSVLPGEVPSRTQLVSGIASEVGWARTRLGRIAGAAPETPPTGVPVTTSAAVR